MALFGFGKKKKEKTAVNNGCGVITSIKVLGGGCKNCHTLLVNTQEAANRLKLSAEVEYITDMEKVMSYGIMQMPLLVINEKVMSYGKVLTTAQAEEVLRKAMG